MPHGSQLDNLKSQFSDLTSDKLSFLDVDMLFFDDSWDFKLRSDMASRGRNESKGGWRFNPNMPPDKYGAKYEFVPLGLDDHYEVDMFGTDNVLDTERKIDRKDGACLHLHGLAVLFCSWLKKNIADSFADGKIDKDIVDLFNSKDDFVQFLRVDNLSGITNDVSTDSDTIKVKPKDVELTYTYRLNPKYLVDVLDKFANLSTSTSSWKLSSYKETERKISVVQASKWLRNTFLDFLDRRLYDVSDAFLHYRASFQGGNTSENKSFAPGCFMQLRTPKNVDWVTWMIEQTSKYDMSQYDVSSYDGARNSVELPLGFEPEIFLTPAVVSEVSTTNFTGEELLEVHTTVPGGYSYSSVATALFSASSPKTYVLNKDDGTNKTYIIDGVEGFSKAINGINAVLPTPAISTVYVNGNRVDFANSHQDTYITKNGYSDTVGDVKTAVPSFLYPRGYSKILSSFSDRFINKVVLQSSKYCDKVEKVLRSDSSLYLPREGYITPIKEDDGSVTKDSSYFMPGPALAWPPTHMVHETLMPLTVRGKNHGDGAYRENVISDACDLGVAKLISEGDSNYDSYVTARVYFPSMYETASAKTPDNSGVLIPDSIIKPYAGEVHSDFSNTRLENKDRWPEFWPMCIPYPSSVYLFLPNDYPIVNNTTTVICTVERNTNVATDKAQLKIKKADVGDLRGHYGAPVMARFRLGNESVGLFATYDGTFSYFSEDVPFTVVESVGAPIVSSYGDNYNYIDIYALHSGINLTVGLGGASRQIFDSLLDKNRNIPTDNKYDNISPASIPVTAFSVANKDDTPELNALPEISVVHTAFGAKMIGDNVTTYPIAAMGEGYHLNRGEKLRIYFRGDFPQYGVMRYLLLGLDGGKPLAAVPIIQADTYATQGFEKDTAGKLSGKLSYLLPDNVPNWATEDASRGYPALKDNEIGFYRRGKILDSAANVTGSFMYPHSRVFAREVVRV